MKMPHACPLPAELQQLLEETLGPEAQGRVSDHVELCDRCQCLLDGLTGCAPPWARALRHLAEAAPSLAPDGAGQPTGA